MGMFCEAYFIFSVGNIKPLIQEEYASCFKSPYHSTLPHAGPACSFNLANAPDYSQIIGITLGMCLLGFIGDMIGRKWGSVTTVCIMLVGAILLINVDAPNAKGFAVFYLIAQFVFGFGVGGEYPMAAGSAAERAEAGGKEKAKHRGREVVLTFSMQGVGNFTNTAVLCILFCCYDAYHRFPKTNSALGFGNGNHPLSNYAPHRLAGVWRTAFGLGCIPLLFMIFYRTVYLRESSVWAANRDVDRSGNSARLFIHYWPRLLATAGSWFLWDFSFYGNKVFQSQFIAIISPGASLIVTLLWTLLNSFCALVGYYFSAALIDNPYFGRLRIQINGFLWVALLFFLSAGLYHPLTSKGGIHTFQFIYFLSSFWGQFGPNCTTFLLAGEVYPTEVRTTAHGLSAGIGKLGALWASVWFNYLASREKFWLTASFNVGGALLTALFVPDPVRVSLTELDRRWNYLKAGRVYQGEAINPRSLSVWERMTGLGKNYNPAQDKADRENEQWDAEQLHNNRTFVAPGQGKTVAV
jgi:MFS family permease